MNDRNGYISLEGLDKLEKAFNKTEKAAIDAALVGLETAGSNIIVDAVLNIKRNRSWTTGDLANSGRTQRNKDVIDVGFFDTNNRNSGYALYVEFGRRSGKMPPPDEMAQYAYKKLKLTPKDRKLAEQIGWAMARKIAKYGTTPHPFFIPAINKNTKGSGIGGVLGTVAESIRKALRGGAASFAFRARQIKNNPVNR